MKIFSFLFAWAATVFGLLALAFAVYLPIALLCGIETTCLAVLFGCSDSSILSFLAIAAIVCYLLTDLSEKRG